MLQYVHYVGNVSLLYTYMLIPFEGIIYFLDVNKCIHLVSGGTHSTFLESYKISYYYCQHIKKYGRTEWLYGVW